MKKTKFISFVLACVLLVSSSFLTLNTAAVDSVSFVTEISNGKIYGIALGSVTADVQLVYYNAVVEVFDKNGNKLGKDDKIGTGYTVKLNGVSYAAIVMGDVTGDAALNSQDYLAIKRSYLGTGYIGIWGHEAAEVKPGSSVSAINYIKVKRACFGTYDINRKYTSEPYNPGDRDPGWTPGWV